MNELFGVLILAFLASNSVLIRSAGLDSAERLSRRPRTMVLTSAVIVCTALLSHIISFVILTFLLPLVGIGASTVTDGVIIVFSTLTVTVAEEQASKRWLPQVRRALGGSMFDIGYNSASVGIVLLSRAAATDFGKSLLYCIAFSASVVIMYFLIYFWRNSLKEHRLPRVMRGTPILLLLLGLAAMALEGYTGGALPI